MSTPDEMKALIDSVAHDIVEHRWPHVDAEAFEELRQAHLDLAEKIVTEVLAALSAHPGERFAFTDAEWREYQAMPEQGYSHRGKLEFFVNRWLSAHPAEETVTTVEELDALPVGTILRGSQGDGIEITQTRSGNTGAQVTGVHGTFSLNWVGLPARVLYRPVPEGSETA